MIRSFTGTRPHPPAEYAEKGITNSGAEPDYEGVIFPDGTVVIRWQTAYRSHSVWACWDDFYQVHGHPEYGTVIEFADGRPAPRGAKSVHDEAGALRHDASWHLREAERLLEEAAAMDDENPASMRRWSYAERSACHSALAAAMAAAQ